MNQEKELERHIRILEQIKNANTKEELPNVIASTLSTFFASNVYFDNNHISSKEFSNMFDAIMTYGSFDTEEVKNIFIDILRKNYPYRDELDYLNKYIEIASHPKINYLMIEILERNKKIDELIAKDDLEKHETTMEEIKNATDVKLLPKVSRAYITRYISDNSQTEYNEKINVSKFYDLVDLLVKGYFITNPETRVELFNICKEANPEHANEIHVNIIKNLLKNKKLNYLVDEVREKEKRTTWIYKNDHEKTMEGIKKAKRISQLPPNLSLSTITGYLCGNSTIYPKGDRIPSGEFVEIANQLMKGKTFDDREIINELARIALEYYPDRFEEAVELLINKLSDLPKTYYYAEEVREALLRQKEFIARGSSNVNVYFVPNPKNQVAGGKFYNCYISRAQNLDLEEILPLKLDDIVPKEMEVDNIEWYVQENYDETFKAAGGIILNKDETIGNVNIFQPSDGKIGITQEQHSKYQELEDLSKQVKEIIARKKKETSDFAKLQEAFLKSQQATDEELAALEAKIDLLTQEGPKMGGRR